MLSFPSKVEHLPPHDFSIGKSMFLTYSRVLLLLHRKSFRNADVWSIGGLKVIAMGSTAEGEHLSVSHFPLSQYFW